MLAAQLVLALEPQVPHRHLERVEDLLALDQRVTFLDLEPLDREGVERLLDLRAGEEQRLELRGGGQGGVDRV